MAQRDRQIAALKRLASLYWSIRPDTFREFPLVAEFYKVEQQLAREDRKFSREIDAARRELLATGFPVPNSWLTVQAVGGVRSRQWRVGKSSKFQGRIDIQNPERDRLRGIILPEMYAAQLRLEAGGAAPLESAGGNAPVAATSPINDPLPPGEACIFLAKAMGETDPTARKVTARYERLRGYVPTTKRGKITLIDGVEWRKICQMEKGRRDAGESDYAAEGWKQRLEAEKTKKESHIVSAAAPSRTFPNERARQAALKNGV